MKFFRSHSDKVPAHISEQAEAVRNMPEADRREFIALASVFKSRQRGMLPKNIRGAFKVKGICVSHAFAHFVHHPPVSFGATG